MAAYPSIHDAAADALSHFQLKTRDNGSEFYATDARGDCPDWLRDLCHTAHGDMMPDDWKYQFIHQALCNIAEACDSGRTEYDDISDSLMEYADNDTDVVNATLCDWLASNMTRAGYVDEAGEETGAWPQNGIMQAIQIGQYYERREVYSSVLQSLSAIVEAFEA